MRNVSVTPICCSSGSMMGVLQVLYYIQARYSKFCCLREVLVTTFYMRFLSRYVGGGHIGQLLVKYEVK